MEEVQKIVKRYGYRNGDCDNAFSFHNAYKIVWMRHGQANVRINSLNYAIRKGHMVIVGRYEDYDICMGEEEGVIDEIILNASRLDKTIGDRRLLAPLRNRPEGFEHVFDMSCCYDDMDILVQKLAQESKSTDPYAEIVCLSTATTLLAYLQRSLMEKSAINNRQIPNMILAVQAYLEEHFAEPVSISEISARVYLSPCYLTHCFKDTTGYSPKQYLVLHRLACAKELLSQTDMPVSQVALESGFPDVNNFIRTFKKDMGTTPLRYRDYCQTRAG